MNILVSPLLAALSLTSFEPRELNCRRPLNDAYEAMICRYVVDTIKLKRVDCLGEGPRDSYEIELCESMIVPRENRTLDCLGPLAKPAEKRLCETVPHPETIHFIDCLGELGDGYEMALCESVDIKFQQELRERL